MDLPPTDSSSITPAASSTPRPPPTPAPAVAADSTSQPQPPSQQDPNPDPDFPPPPTSDQQTDQQPEDSQDDEPPRPPFNPLFTLIHDPLTNTTAHPRHTHYLFSDDDASAILSSACTRAASQEPHPDAPPEERILIIDMDESGTRVQRTASLSPAWQVLRADVQGAPALRGEEPREAGGEVSAHTGMMLKIEGAGVGSAPVLSSSGKRSTGKRKSKGKGKGKGIPGPDESEPGDGEERYEEGNEDVDEEEAEEEDEREHIDLESDQMRALIADFDRRMEVLRSVVAGTGRVPEAGDEGEEKGE